jgi:EAL domain-containing protein (putative c-di-GMP-specific phosphodiesterase class I)
LARAGLTARLQPLVPVPSLLLAAPVPPTCPDTALALADRIREAFELWGQEENREAGAAIDSNGSSSSSSSPALRRACRESRAWLDGQGRPLRLAINLSASQFKDPRLAELIGQIITDTGFDATRLEFEITEHTLMEDTRGTLDTLRALVRLGASISVDDFGTGYSSLSYLQRFSVQRLKIDRSFIADISEKRDTAAIVEAIISLARSLRIEVVAEGVQTEAQRDFLLSRGCTLMQGHFFHAAMPPARMQALLDHGEPTAPAGTDARVSIGPASAPGPASSAVPEAFPDAALAVASVRHAARS